MAGLRVGLYTRLATLSGFGVLLVTGMLVNQQITDRSVQRLSTALEAQKEIVTAVLDAEIAIRRAEVAVRDIRLAQSAEQVEAGRRNLSEQSAAWSGQLDAALQKSTNAENRERLAKAKTLQAEFSAAAGEFTDAQKQILALLAKRNQATLNWDETLKRVMSLPALAELANRHEVESALRQAQLDYTAVRAAGWRLSVTGESAQAELVSRGTDTFLGTLRQARASVAEKSVGDGLNQAIAAGTVFKNITEDVVQTERLRNETQAKRMLPNLHEASGLMDKIEQSAKQFSEIAAHDEDSAMAQGNRVGLGVGLVVIVVLIGSGAFSILTLRRANVARREEMHKLAEQFDKAVGGIVNSVSSAATELEASATTLTHTAETEQQLASSVAAASEQASTNVQSVASAADEMSASVAEIGRQVQESSRIADDAVSQAQKTDARIGELSQAASRIGDVVKLITAIAEQTNLLALNATIEAARAGEAGRGFAVVAQEVKALAAQTAKATDEISTQIGGMQAATQDSVTAIKEIGSTIARIAEIAAAIAAAVEEQGSATQEIARNVQQAAEGTSQVAVNIVEVNRGASETGAASTQVLSSARELATQGNKLKLEVDRLLTTVRAA